jgi:hypothetical protein
MTGCWMAVPRDKAGRHTPSGLIGARTNEFAVPLRIVTVLGAADATHAIRCPSESGLSLVIKATLYKAGEGVGGRVGVGAFGMQFQSGAALCRERHQVQNALAAYFLVTAGEHDVSLRPPDLGTE